jgi:hypothetical protein
LADVDVLFSDLLLIKAWSNCVPAVAKELPCELVIALEEEA